MRILFWTQVANAEHYQIPKNLYSSDENACRLFVFNLKPHNSLLLCVHVFTVSLLLPHLKLFSHILTLCKHWKGHPTTFNLEVPLCLNAFAQNLFFEVREVVNPLLDFIHAAREARARQDEEERFKSNLYWVLAVLGCSGLWWYKYYISTGEVVYSQQYKVNSEVYAELAKLNSSLAIDNNKIAKLCGILAELNNKLASFNSTLATADNWLFLNSILFLFVWVTATIFFIILTLWLELLSNTLYRVDGTEELIYLLNSFIRFSTVVSVFLIINLYIYVKVVSAV